MSALSDAGGVVVGSAAEAATGAEALIVMVVNAAQVEAVLFDGGAAAALPEGGTVIVTATCAPNAVEQIAAKVEGMGRRLIDAPVSGGVAGASAGSQVTMMVAAPDALFAALRPVLDVMGGKVAHVGTRPGQGAVVKSVNQLLCGVHIACDRGGAGLGRQDGHRSGGDAGHRQHFGGVELDAEGPRPAYAGGLRRKCAARSTSSSPVNPATGANFGHR